MRQSHKIKKSDKKKPAIIMQRHRVYNVAVQAARRARIIISYAALAPVQLANQIKITEEDCAGYNE